MEHKSKILFLRDLLRLSVQKTREIIAGILPPLPLVLVLLCFTALIIGPSVSHGSETPPKRLVDASSDNFPPMNMLDEHEQLTGFGRELADAVVTAMGGEVTHIHSPLWPKVLKWLETGKADFIHDVGYTEERDEFLDYSDPIIEMPENIFVRSDRYDITGTASLDGKTVACVNKHISHLYMQNFPSIRLFVVETPTQALYELVNGKVDAVVYPRQIMLYLAQNLRLMDKIKIIGEPLRTLTWSMAVREGDRELLEYLNQGLAMVKADGRYQKLYDKWWGERLFSGYTHKELVTFVVLASSASALLALVITLSFFYLKLRAGKKRLELEVAERKRGEVRLVRAKEEAERANKAKSEFLANMSHEIRTPLNGITGMLQVLKLSDLDHEQQMFADNALLAGKRLTKLLADILDVSAVEAGKLRLSIHKFNLKGLLNSVETLLCLSAREKGVDLRLHLDPALPDTINGDEARLRQILFNLVGNGLKFTTNGYVSVDVSALASWKTSFGGLLFIISDTGPGIDDRHVDAAFEMFEQVSRGYTRTHQGAGLGLPIVKRLTSLMGGTICVDSAAGKGTTFYVSIPIPDAAADAFGTVESEQARRKAHAAERPDASKTQKILLVEDEPVNAFAVTQLLHAKGLDVVGVENGALALEALRDTRFDAVLMDIQMPVLDGVEATRRIRKGEAGDNNRSIPVIAMTAYAMDGDREKFLGEGINDYIAKPINMKKLDSILTTVGRMRRDG